MPLDLSLPAGYPLVPLLETPRIASACRERAAVTAIIAALPSSKIQLQFEI